MGSPEHTYASVKDVPVFPATQLPFLLLLLQPLSSNGREKRIIFLDEYHQVTCFLYKQLNLREIPAWGREEEKGYVANEEEQRQRHAGLSVNNVI